MGCCSTVNTPIRSKVVIGDMDVSGAEAVVTSITKNGGWVIVIGELRELNQVYREAVFVKCNVVNWDDQVALFELAFERYGVVDIVVRILSCYHVAEPRMCSDPF